MQLPGGTWIFIGGDGMFFLKKTPPINYDVLCRQTVTVYHQEEGKYTRRVHERAFLDFRKNLSVDNTGSKEANTFLLILPGTPQQIFAGDKVLLGIGPEIATREDWAAFTPNKEPGLVVVSYVDPKYWNGELVHTEAGG